MCVHVFVENLHIVVQFLSSKEFLHKVLVSKRVEGHSTNNNKKNL